MFISAFLEGSVYAQTVEISDDGVKQCLVEDYPDLVNNSDELIIASANAFTDKLVCTGFGIDYLSDIQYFTSANKVDFSDNNIHELSPLVVLTQLESIDASNNSLEDEIDLSDFNSLKDFSANGNRLNLPPVFSSNIESIDLGNNNLQDTLDVTGLTNLTSLILYENDLKGIKNIETLVNLENLDVHTNDLAILPDLDNITTLKTVDFSVNRFQNLPLLYLPSLELVKATDNKLTFEDFLLFTDLAIFPTAFPDLGEQAVQAKILTDTVMENQLWDWFLPFDKLVTSNIYYWFKNGEAYDTTTTVELEIEKVALSDAGDYTCEVINTNPKLSGFKIFTTARTLVIIPDTTTIDTTLIEKECFELLDLIVDIDTPSCTKVAYVSLNPMISGEIQGELNYSVNNEIIEGTEFELDSEGIYTVKVFDDKCSNTTTSFEIVFDFLNCNTESFSPNGDGLEDTYYVNLIGQSKIYNKGGELIKTLSTPSFWDGTDDQGVLQPLGHYVIITDNEENVNVTLIR